jgi:hypothetical protein
VLFGKEDKQVGFSLKNGFRLLSAYLTVNGEKLRITTETDRSITTILFPRILKLSYNKRVKSSNSLVF